MINEREETEGEWCGQRRYHGQRLAVERSLCVIKPRAEGRGGRGPRGWSLPAPEPGPLSGSGGCAGGRVGLPTVPGASPGALADRSGDTLSPHGARPGSIQPQLVKVSEQEEETARRRGSELFM